jgi:anti-anti-sigma regulatory factor
MALKIRHQDEIFLVEGNINATTIKQFKNHLEFLLLFCKSLTINIDGLESIDNDGVQVLKELYNTSLLTNKKFLIMGIKSEEIYRNIHSNNAA